MNYEQEFIKLFSEFGRKLLSENYEYSHMEIRFIFRKLLNDKFGNNLGKLLDEGIDFHPSSGLDVTNLTILLEKLNNEIHSYFSQDNHMIDAYKLLKLRSACFCSALLDKKEQLKIFSDFGLKYHKKTDNTSWHNSTDEWVYMINQSDEFILAFKTLKKLLIRIEQN